MGYRGSPYRVIGQATGLTDSPKCCISICFRKLMMEAGSNMEPRGTNEVLNMMNRGVFKFLGIGLLCAALSLVVSCDSGSSGGGSDKSSVTLGVCIGDSITRGLGVATPYPAVLSGITGKTFVNLGRDGATSSDGLSAVRSALSRNPSQNQPGCHQSERHPWTGKGPAGRLCHNRRTRGRKFD